MKFKDLRTGDVMNLMGTRSVILAIEKPHPVRVGFWLFVWYIFDEKRLSFDALHPEFDLIPGSFVNQDGLYSYQRALAEIPR
jgi:hypothetical protein